MRTVKYYNLSNGILALGSAGLDAKFIRIQSSLCERKKWSKIIEELDYDFLMNLALGNKCVVYDFGAEKEVSRAIYQGLEFVRFAVNMIWFYSSPNPYVKDHNCVKYFNEELLVLSERSRSKLKYFRKFLGTFIGPVNLEGVSNFTDMDNKYSDMSDILHDWNEKADFESNTKYWLKKGE